jgi:hypothetical protein
MYDAYVNTVSNNKLFDWEQSKFLKRNYQNPYFVMPTKEDLRSDMVYIISTFDHSINLELAITAVQMQGVKKENIMAIPLDKKGEKRLLFDSLHSSDGLSLFDLPALLAVFFGIFGGIYGFILEWGPLIWGLIAIFAGAILGFVIKLISTKRYGDRQKDKRGAEVVVIINCIESQLEMIRDILWSHHALGVRKLDLDNIDLDIS